MSNLDGKLFEFMFILIPLLIFLSVFFISEKLKKK